MKRTITMTALLLRLLAEIERELYLPQNNTNTVMQGATKNDNVAGCQKRLSPIKLATLQN